MADESRFPVIRSGAFVARRFNDNLSAFVVFCCNPECAHYVHDPAAFPHWTEDLPERLGLLRCLACGSPVVRPQDADSVEP
ncbi:MAG: hypothetical protein AB1758_23350 [Candidatus Eremiobacterota bacterium]